MELKTHNRYAYSPISERPDYDWPEGKRLAVYFALNIEHFSFGEGLGHTPTQPGTPPDVRNYSWRDYGLRVGIWRIFDLFDELELPACHLMNTAVYDYAPQIPARIRTRGDEFIGHGRTNSEEQAGYSEYEERLLIGETTETLRRHEGQPPGGWMGPWISESVHTPDLLKEAGYRYLLDWCADDQPFWMTTRSGPILSIPYHIEINDSPAQLTRRHTADDFTRMVTAHFDEQLRQSRKQSLVFNLALHTFVSGQPYRLAGLRDILLHILNHPNADKVWFTRPGAIYDHIVSLPEGVVP
ncbi:MAG: polysaccharide deacetylase family protein [Gammaproteobacteria bacterium]|nr:polysaccharide deacetylase family protein [Gammaproteobacteria bacterium]